MNIPQEPTQSPRPTNQDSGEALPAKLKNTQERPISLLERIRRSPLRRPIAAIMALSANIPLYFPRQMESSESQNVSNDDGQELRLSEEDVQELMASQREMWDDLHVTFDEDTETHIVTIDPGSSEEYAETTVAGAQHHLETRVQTNWLGRQGERGAQLSDGETEAIQIDAEKTAEEVIRPFTLLELDADNAVRTIHIKTIGHSSAEGPDQLNLEGSQWRADLVAQAYATAFEDTGIDGTKITVEAQGQGAEGTIADFIQVLSDTGNPIAGQTPEQQEAAALSLIRQIHDAPDTVSPDILHTFQTDLASHRGVDLTIDVEGYDATLRTPLSVAQGDPVTQTTLAYLDYYDPAERTRNMPYIVEPVGGFPPPIPEPPTPKPPERSGPQPPPGPDPVDPVPPTKDRKPPKTKPHPPVVEPPQPPVIDPPEPPTPKPPERSGPQPPPGPDPVDPVDPVPPTKDRKPPETKPRPPVVEPPVVEPPVIAPPEPPVVEPPVVEPPVVEPPVVEPPVVEPPVVEPPVIDPPEPPPIDDPPPPKKPKKKKRRRLPRLTLFKGLGGLRTKDPVPQTPRSRRNPGQQTASGLGPTKGETIGRAPSRSMFGRSAKRHHTGKK